jgi:hypothetical protein
VAAIWFQTRWTRGAEALSAWRHVLVAGAAYLALSLVLTWPLIRGIARDVPADLADPLLNCWILAWGVTHILRLLGGDWGAFHGFWDTNAFYPHRLTLAYSEHMIVPALQATPIYALSGNIILAYNCLFLSAFVLSGIGAYLLTAELTGDRRAAFVAGLLFAFAPYRFDQLPHLQVMSTQWMPFALLGFRRYVVTQRLRYCCGGLLALIAQGLSCGYFLLFFSPFVALYAVWEMARHGRLRDVRMWFVLVLAALIFVAVTIPFLVPYMELRTLEPTARDTQTVRAGSADVFSYVSSNSRSLIWGRVLTTIRRGEGQLFPGLATLILAGSALVLVLRRRLAASAPETGLQPWRRFGIRAVSGVAFLAGVSLLITLSGPGMRVRLGLATLTISSFSRTTLYLALALAALLLLSRRARQVCQGWTRSTTLFLALLGGLAAYLSLGPVPTARARIVSVPPLYSLLYEYVPGFDGLRVPARYAMIVTLALALLGGIGAGLLLRKGRWARASVVLLMVFFLIEAPFFPFPLNVSWGTGKVQAPSPPQLGDQAPSVYQFVKSLPPDAVILEMPVGYTYYETRAMFYSTLHWHRIVNGYSGHFPGTFVELATALKRLLIAPGEGLAALRRSGASHVIVHRDAWRGHRAARVLRVLRQGGLEVLGDFGDATVLKMPPPRPSSPSVGTR